MKTPYSGAVANAARIGIEYGFRLGEDGCVLIATVDVIMAAANALAAHENAPGFEWEDQGDQWPEVCAMLAKLVDDPNGPGMNEDHWFTVIRLHLKAAKTAERKARS